MFPFISAGCQNTAKWLKPDISLQESTQGKCAGYKLMCYTVTKPEMGRKKLSINTHKYNDKVQNLIRNMYQSIPF